MLKRNHRTIGRVVQEQGEFTILQTGEHAFIAAPTNELLPAGEKEAEFELRMALADVVTRARLLGVPMERLESLLKDEAA